MTDGGWDFEVRRIDLNGLSIDAGQRLGMLIVQPEYELLPDGPVPFRISDAWRDAQHGLIQKAFQIRAAESQERHVHIPFILFPEAAIPVREPNGLNLLRQQMEEAHDDVIFIGGLEGLKRQEALEIADEFAPGLDIAKPDCALGAFVNVCVIVIKLANGQLSWYFQAKLRPSQWEQQRNMARGRRVLYFVAPGVAFLCQICFDHIAAAGEEPLNDALCHQLIQANQPNAAPMDFVFVLQHNPKPGHMMENTGRLLNYGDRLFMNKMTAVIMVNKAASSQEPSQYGKSGFHYKVGRWQVPDSDVGPTGYELYNSSNVTSAIFRKRTQAIHVATLVPSSDNIGNPGNLRRPLENPRSYLITEGCEVATLCSCLPGTTCPVGNFVECDCLPCKLYDVLPAALPTKDRKNRWRGSNEGQSQRLQNHYREIRKNLLKLECARARNLVDLLLHMHKPEESKNPDIWSDLQSEAVVELLSALSVLAELDQVNFQTAPGYWTAVLGQSLAVAMLDGAGKEHWTDIERVYRKDFVKRYRVDVRRKPVLLAALRSQGHVKDMVERFSLDITEPTGPNRLGDEDTIAKPIPLRLYVCHDALFEEARHAPVIADFLRSNMRCVLE